jgi:hypothetical protein
MRSRRPGRSRCRASPVPRLAARPAAAAAPQPRRVAADPEPWYYGFLVVYATGTMALGLTVCGIVMIFGLYTAFPTVGGETKLVPYGLLALLPTEWVENRL